jgi:Retron-type reverse transcriptase
MNNMDEVNTSRRSMEMLEEITAVANLNKAFMKVRKNNGAGGVDRMEIKELQPYLKAHGEELVCSILDGEYRPNPVRRVEIPKENGKTRGLGIPTAVDRVFQQAIEQVLTPIYEPEFAETIYGFRPGRSAHDAIRKCLEYANQDKLVQILSRKIADGRVISLIRKYLNAGVMVGKEYRKSDIGVPQGGNLSPLLANVMLNELDHELERRGHKFVRYADDMVIFSKSKRGANETLKHIQPFIEGKLFLKVNMEKTKVADIGRIKFLGYGFRYSVNGVKATVHAKSKAKLKAKVKEITRRSGGRGYEWKKRKLKQMVIGWVNYFKLADMKTWLTAVDEWLRTRLRTYIWKSWKTITNKYRNLRKLGTTERNAGIMANTRKGYRRSADSPIVKLAISKELLKQAGYTFFLDYYLAVKV